MALDSEIIVVSGLPRSGTSLMMQMLARGGVEVVTDRERVADPDNPRGYYEFERVKRIKHDTTWLAEARGRAVKMVSPLLYDLPATERYRVIFMQRELEEVLVSQEKMLERLGRAAAPRERLRASFRIHLERLDAWLPKQAHLAVLLVSYNDLLERPLEQVERISHFLDDQPSVEAMCEAIDPGLYRNRRSRC